MFDGGWEGTVMGDRGCGGDHEVGKVDCHDPSCHKIESQDCDIDGMRRRLYRCAR